MIDKPKGISNPLTIIGVFATITEAGGTVVLPFLTPANQNLYMWFLMVFPSLLLLLFFAILYWKHTALYSPSDYKSDNSFVKAAQMVMLVKDNKIELKSEDASNGIVFSEMADKSEVSK